MATSGWDRPSVELPSNYNSVAEESLASRQESPEIGLREANNFAKEIIQRQAAELSCHAAGEPLDWLDMCCGKSGDVGKVMHIASTRRAPLRYVGVDCSERAIADAQKR